MTPERRELLRATGFSLLELQVAMILLVISILAISSGLSNVDRHLDKLEGRQHAVLRFSPDGKRAVFSSITTLRRHQDARVPLEILTLYKRKDRCCGVILRIEEVP